jgi:hypothetical protein
MIVIVAAAMFFVVIGFYSTKKQQTTTSVMATSAKKIDELLLPTTSVNPHDSAKASSSALSSESQSALKPLTKADIEIVNNWKRDQWGYMYETPNDAYVSYDQQTLEKLAGSGDVRAIQALAKLLDSQYKFSEAQNLYKRAAVLGSTYALAELSRTAAGESIGELALDVKKAHVLESMAYAKVAAMRGDSFRYFADMGVPTATNPTQIPLTQDDYASVQPLAQKIYDSLQTQRSELGLGAFDNSVPPEVAESFRHRDPRIYMGAKARY